MENVNLSKSRKIINIVLFVLFVLFAAIQLNDPDPVKWFLIYIGVAVISLMSNYKRFSKILIWGIAFGLLIYAGLHIMFLIDWLQIDNKSDIFGEMVYDKPYLEGAREFIGLIMAFLAVLFQIRK